MGKINITEEDIQLAVEHAMVVIKNKKGAIWGYYSLKLNRLVVKPRNKLTWEMEEQLNQQPELVAIKIDRRLFKANPDIEAIRDSLVALAERLNGKAIERSRNKFKRIRTGCKASSLSEEDKKENAYLIPLTQAQRAETDFPLTVKFKSSEMGHVA